MIHWGVDRRDNAAAAAFGFAFEGWYYHIGRNYALCAHCGSSIEPWWLARCLKIPCVLKVTHERP